MGASCESRQVGASALCGSRRGSRGPLWQHQYWDRFGRDEKEFHERLEYMHLNPVKKGLGNRDSEFAIRDSGLANRG